MKYIRTKDWVYAEEKYKVAKAFVSMLEEEQAKIMPTTKTNFDIIKQADTIEELCNEFVCIKYGAYGKLNPWILSDFEILKRENNYPTAQIFGAIWTDKGLIYVAKMNDKGELELL